MDAAAAPRRHVERCMGTVFSIDVRAPGVAGSAIADVIAWLHRVDRTFSTYRADSAIRRLGRGELRPADCHPEVRAVLAACADLSERTGGYFSAYADGALDPSGYVKGWAIQRAGELLAERGSVNHCVNGGGDVQCAGSAAPDRPWRIGVADPADAGRLLGVAVGEHMAVATSGSAERGTHIVDPHRRSWPTGLLAVTVVGRDLAEVDAYATAAFAMGDGAARWLAEQPGVDALIVDRYGRVDVVTGQDACARVEIGTGSPPFA